MDKVKDYRRRAEECRLLATVAPPELRPHYQDLAIMWDRMAGERLTFFVAPEAAQSNVSDEK
jgi:hypothetical protein